MQRRGEENLAAAREREREDGGASSGCERISSGQEGGGKEGGGTSDGKEGDQPTFDRTPN